MEQTTYAVSGMTCQHCVKNVQTKLSAVAGVSNVAVQLMPPRAVVEGAGVALADLESALAGSQFKIQPLGA